MTRGPSLDPTTSGLAVEVEDHPLDYGDFEGTIPEGRVWRRHGAAVGPRLLGRRRAKPAQAFAKGELKFTLDGERLHGGWVLVRMQHDRSGGKRTNWLLIKHRDESAREGNGDDIWRQDRSVASGRTMEQIAAGKGRAPKPFMMSGRVRGRTRSGARSRGGSVIAQERDRNGRHRETRDR